MTEIANFIHGKRVAAADGQTTDLVDPSTGEVYATAPLSREADVDAAFQDSARAFESWRDTTPSERQRALLRIADAIEERAEELVDVESQNTGKPKQLTMDEEIPPMCDQIRFFAGAARMLEGTAAGEYMAGFTSFIRREPVGVCAAVTPWNYPAMMAVWKWAPALAAGNTMVLKPSDTTPASTVWMAELMAEFLPEGVFNVVCGDRDTGAALVSHPTPAMVSITGSVGAGIAVAKAAADDVKRVHLELGGKAPVIVFDDADLELAAENIAIAGYFNAGQDCTAATRVLAGPGIHDDFVAALGEQAKGTRTGPPDDGEVLYGPLNNANQLAQRQRVPRAARPTTRPSSTGGQRQGDTRLLLRADHRRRPAPGRRHDPERDLRPGHHRPDLRRRGQGGRVGQRRRLRRSPRACGRRTTGARCAMSRRLDFGCVWINCPHPARGRDAARRLQEVRLRQGPVAVRLRGLHARQARHVVSRWVTSTPLGRSVARKRSSSASDGVWVVDPRKVACPGKPNEAKVRIRRGERLTLLRRSEGVVFGQRRSVGVVSARQRSPRIRSRRYPRRRQSATQAIKLSMLSTFRRVCATSTSSSRSSTRSGCSTMTCCQNLRLPSRVAFEKRCLPSRWPMSGSPTGSIRSGGRPHDAERRADERKARHAVGSVEREGDGQERAHRVGDDIDGRELEPVHDIP